MERPKPSFRHPLEWAPLAEGFEDIGNILVANKVAISLRLLQGYTLAASGCSGVPRLNAALYASCKAVYAEQMT